MFKLSKSFHKSLSLSLSSSSLSLSLSSPYTKCFQYLTQTHINKYLFSQYHDTIFALSTNNIKSAIGIIRVSGQHALRALSFIDKKYKINESKNNLQDYFKNTNILTLLQNNNIKPYTCHHRKFWSILDIDNKNQRKLIDEGLVIYFPEPKSFTGEDIIELQIHGSKAVQAKFLYELGKIPDYRMAEQGEFTKRAFFNGKLDLMKVEGLSDLLNSETEEQRSQSIHHYIGSASDILEKWRKSLIECLAHAEAYIDFEEDEEDVKADVYDKVADKINDLINQLTFHLQNKNRGEILRDGYKISIIGPPNAGKSSLINLLAQRDVAIVSDIPGTTRDILSVSLNLGGFPVIISDTAGLRETNDPIESAGVQRAIKNSIESHMILLMIDANDISIEIEETNNFQKHINHDQVYLPNLQNHLSKNQNNLANYQNSQSTITYLIKMKDENKLKVLMDNLSNSTNNSNNVVVLLNKIDTLTQLKTGQMIKNPNEFLSPNSNKKLLYQDKQYQISQLMSCKDEKTIAELVEKITNKVKIDLNNNVHDSVNGLSIITKARHRIELENCLMHLKNFIQNKNSIEISAEELRSAVVCIGKLTGRVDVEEVLDVLFKDFCIGKQLPIFKHYLKDQDR